MVVAMDEDARLLQAVGDQRVEHVGERRALAARERRPRCLPTEPFGKQRHLPAQQRIVIGRQLRRMRCACAGCAPARRWRRRTVGRHRPGVQLHQVGLRAEIGVEQKALLLVAPSTRGAFTPMSTSIAAIRMYGSMSSLAGGASIAIQLSLPRVTRK